MDEKLYEFRMSQAIKMGKQWALDPPDAGEAEGSSQAPSPLSALDGLETLKLDSSGSSTAITPADSPATIPQPSLTDTLALPLSLPPKLAKQGHLDPWQVSPFSGLLRQPPLKILDRFCH